MSLPIKWCCNDKESGQEGHPEKGDFEQKPKKIEEESHARKNILVKGKLLV